MEGGLFKGRRFGRKEGGESGQLAKRGRSRGKKESVRSVAHSQEENWKQDRRWDDQEGRCKERFSGERDPFGRFASLLLGLHKVGPSRY